MKKDTTIVGYSKVLARAKKDLNLAEYKIFILALSKISQLSVNNNLIVSMTLQEITEATGISTDANHAKERLKAVGRKLVKGSYVEFDKKDGGWGNGNLIAATDYSNKVFALRFDELARPLIEGLQATKNYITILAEDIYGFDSEYSYLLYEHLRLYSDTRITNTRILTDSELKKIFKLSDDAYVFNGHFDRWIFEKRIMKKIDNDLKSCRLITFEKQGDFIFEKVKDDKGFIIGYKFIYKINEIHKIEQNNYLCTTI